MAYASAKEITANEIPVIDVAALRAGSASALQSVARQMREAAEAVGFFYIRNHGIPQAVLDATDRAARRFFACPLEDKLQVEPLDRHRGFLSVGQAKMYDKAKIDLKESFIWGLDIAEDDPDYRAGNRMFGPNRWPRFVPEMRPAFNAFFDAANACGKMVLTAFAASLEVAPDYFTRCFAKPVTRGSVVYYPPQPPDAGEDQFGVAPHTDYGTITFVYQDDVGGLQVYSSARREWLTAHPIPGTLVVNVGDLLARWTNDSFRSTPHRVVNKSGRERLSIAAFVDPDFHTPIVPVVKPGEAARYEAVTCGEYILGRFDKAFAYRK
jgi:isopenicillin N synthase-like dioxygenase